CRFGLCLFGLSQFGAGCCVGSQVPKNELRGGQYELLHLRGLVKLRPVSERAVENPPFAETANPDHSVLVVRTRGVLIGAQSGLRRIETDQEAQFIPGVRSGWKEVIEFVFEVETLVGEM